MPKKPQDYRGELREILNALADAVADASDRDILADAQEEGLNPEAEADKMKALLRRSVDKFRKRKLEQARLDYERASSALFTKTYKLPDTPRQKRDLLTNLLISQPQMQGMLTVQFRELNQLSDEDVENSLKKLAELGVLDDLTDKPTEE